MMDSTLPAINHLALRRKTGVKKNKTWSLEPWNLQHQVLTVDHLLKWMVLNNSENVPDESEVEMYVHMFHYWASSGRFQLE